MFNCEYLNTLLLTWHSHHRFRCSSHHEEAGVIWTSQCLATHVLGSIVQLYYFDSNAVEDGVFCFKKCPSQPFDLDCFLNSTHVVSYHYVTLPTINELLNGSITLFSFDSSTNTYYPNVVFQIIDGNEEGLFSVTQENLYRGTYRPHVNYEEKGIVICYTINQTHLERK